MVLVLVFVRFLDFVVKLNHNQPLTQWRGQDTKGLIGK